jgi:hypothetical protein
VIRLILGALAALLLAPPAPIHITAQSRSLQPGELVVLSIELPEPSDQLRVRAFDRDLAAYPAGGRACARWSGSILTSAGTYAVSVEAGAARRAFAPPTISRSRRASSARAGSRSTRRSSHPPSEQARIEREAALLTDVWKTPAAERLWTDLLVRPVPQDANSAFGTRSIFNGKPRNARRRRLPQPGRHADPRAPNAGRIVVARNLYFSGNTVIIDHGLGLFSMLAHLSAIDVHEGERVTAGQLLGKVGATGTRHRPAPALGRARERRASIRCRRWRCWENRRPAVEYSVKTRRRPKRSSIRGFVEYGRGIQLAKPGFHIWTLVPLQPARFDGPSVSVRMRLSASSAQPRRLGVRAPLQPAVDLRGTTTELFDDAMAALQRHAAIERVLIDEGWMLEDFESVIGATLAHTSPGG